MLFFEEKISAVEKDIIEGTYGYDVHFQILSDNPDPLVLAQGEAVRKEGLQKIQEIAEKNGLQVYYSDAQFNMPVGPWETPMWQIVLTTIDDKTADPSHPRAMDKEKLKMVYQVMRLSASYIQEIYKKSGMEVACALFIHAKVFPNHSNAIQDRVLHLDADKPWCVFGAPRLKNIWDGPSGSIAMEEYVTSRLQQGIEEAEIIASFKQQFGEYVLEQNPQKKEERLERQVRCILAGQTNLSRMRHIQQQEAEEIRQAAYAAH